MDYHFHFYKLVHFLPGISWGSLSIFTFLKLNPQLNAGDGKTYYVSVSLHIFLVKILFLLISLQGCIILCYSRLYVETKSQNYYFIMDCRSAPLEPLL